MEERYAYMVRAERTRYRVPRKISPTPDSMKNTVEGSGTGITLELKLAEYVFVTDPPVVRIGNQFW